MYFHISVRGVVCSDYCKCYYNQKSKRNIMNCENITLTALPATVPTFTDWIRLRNINMSNFCTNYPYLKETISYLTIKSSNMAHICDDVLKSILHSKTIREISFRNNKLTGLSFQWKTKSSNVERLWLSGNPIACDCDMLWMMNWLQNSTGATGHRLVQDYEDVICATGPQAGTPVYKLNRVKMGCYPKHIPIWIIVTASSVGGVILFVVIGTIFVHRHRRLVRWLIYKNFDKLLGDPDRNEDISDKQFDAFISFRLVTLIEHV